MFDDFGNDSMFDDDFIDMQMSAGSRQEAIDLTGDDTFYTGPDNDDEDDPDDQLSMAGLDRSELECMDEDQRREALENAGLDPDDFDDILMSSGSYCGKFNIDSDDEEDEDDLEEDLLMAGLNRFELECMDEDERDEALENAGLDPDDYVDFF